MSELYFCVFSDYHYWPTHYPISTDGLATIMADAHNRGASLVVQCGDLVHNAPTAPELISLFRDNPYGLTTLGCIGNHEMEAVDSFQVVLDCYGMENNYYFRDINGFRMIFLDTNYYRNERGIICHNPPRSHNAPSGDGDYIPDEELKWLKHTLLDSAYPCLLFSHASLECSLGCKNAEKVRGLIRETNADHPGCVLMCINGHHHRNSITIQDNVVFFDVNATYNGHWQPQKHTAFPKEFAESARMAANIFLFNDPLHAFVHVCDNGKIEIEGMETTYRFGVSPESLGMNSINRFGRVCEPRISSFHNIVQKI